MERLRNSLSVEGSTNACSKVFRQALLNDFLLPHVFKKNYLLRHVSQFEMSMGSLVCLKRKQPLELDWIKEIQGDITSLTIFRLSRITISMSWTAT